MFTTELSLPRFFISYPPLCVLRESRIVGGAELNDIGVPNLTRIGCRTQCERALDILFKKILSSKLWILDDWGVVSMKSEIAEEVFDLLDRRRHSSALILTSNRDVDEWGTVFPDPVLAGAAIDRLFDRATTITFLGNKIGRAHV